MATAVNSPFKFLDAYTLQDADAFFGREKEVDQLYEYVNMNKLVLVYGQSGTGKTSLVQCGLASRFDITDWYPIFIRRQSDINRSLHQELQKAARSSYVDDPLETLRRMNARYLRSAFLIFDQFEELLIQGDIEKEVVPFIHQLARILHADDLGCRVILVLREEYIAQLYHFEQQIPTLFDRRLRVEPMSFKNVAAVISKSCQRYNIGLEAPEANTRQIIENVSAGKSGILLPYLQVYLDLLYREAHPPEVQTDGNLPEVVFTSKGIDQLGQIENVLDKFLQEQVFALQQQLNEQFEEVDPNAVKRTLDCFVTAEGTKKMIPFRREESGVKVTPAAPEYLLLMSDQLRSKCLQELENRRIIRANDQGLELAHDSLAALIDEGRSDEERQLNQVKIRIKNGYHEFLNSGGYFSEKQLLNIEEFLPELTLPEEHLQFLEASKEQVAALKQKEEEYQQEKLRLVEEKLAMEQKNSRRRKVWLSFVGLAAVLAVLASAIAFVQKGIADQARYEAEMRSQTARLTEEALRVRSESPTIALKLLNRAYEASDNIFGIAVKTFSEVISDLETPFYQTHFDLGPHSRVAGSGFSADGQQLAVGFGGNAKTISVFNLKGETLHKLKVEDEIDAFDFAPDGQSFLVGNTKNQTIKIIDWEGKERVSIEIPDRTEEAGTGKKGFESLAFSKAGNRIIYLEKPRRNAAFVWDTTGQLVHQFQFLEQGQSIIQIVASPKADYLALVTDRGRSSKGGLRLFNDRGKRIFYFEEEVINSVNFFPDGERIICGSVTGTVFFLSFFGAVEGKFDTGSNGILDVALLPGGNYVQLANNARQDIEIWSRDGNKLYDIPWRLIDNQWPSISPVQPQFFMFNRMTGNNVLSSEVKSLGLHGELWNISAMAPRELPISTEEYNLGVRSPDGKTLLVSPQIGHDDFHPGNELWIRESNGFLLQKLVGHQQGITDAAYSPDGTQVLSGSYDNTAILWSVTGEVQAVLKAHQSTVHSVDFSSQGDRLLTYGGRGRAIVWDNKGNELLSLLVSRRMVQPGLVGKAIFSPDDQHILTVNSEKKIKLWTSDGQLLDSIFCHRKYIPDASFSPDSKRIAGIVADDMVKVWDLEGNVLDSIRILGNPLISVGYTQNGDYLYTIDEKHQVKLWVANPAIISSYPFFEINRPWYVTSYDEKRDYFFAVKLKQVGRGYTQHVIIPNRLSEFKNNGFFTLTPQIEKDFRIIEED